MLREFDRGKLVWKVDWPMRWAYEGVVFEPSGVDHSSPGSSFVVGGQIVARDLRRRAADRPDVRLRRHQRHGQDVVSSKGGVPTPGDALEIMEAPLLRWLYARRRPNQSFKIAFDQEIQRLYDEWDALERKIADGTAQPADAAAYAPRHRHRRRRAAQDARARCRTAPWPRSWTSPPATTSRRCAS